MDVGPDGRCALLRSVADLRGSEASVLAQHDLLVCTPSDQEQVQRFEAELGRYLSAVGRSSAEVKASAVRVPHGCFAILLWYEAGVRAQTPDKSIRVSCGGADNITVKSLSAMCRRKGWQP